MTRILGVECKKQLVYLAVVDDGEIIVVEPQRLDVPAIHEQTARLREFMNDFKRVLADLRPDAVHIAQPETSYQAGYGEIAPKAALETLVRLACLDADVNVEIVHRSSMRAGLGGGKLDDLIAARIEPVGKYWNPGRKYAAAAAVVRKKKK